MVISFNWSTAVGFAPCSRLALLLSRPLILCKASAWRSLTSESLEVSVAFGREVAERETAANTLKRFLHEFRALFRLHIFINNQPIILKSTRTLPLSLLLNRREGEAEDVERRKLES